MRIMKKSEKVLLSFVLVIAIMMSVVACALVVRAEKVDDLAPSGAESYYLWGLNTNDPDFGSMQSPTGAFSYDGTKGYYYYDLVGVGGDYCFVVSKVNNSGYGAQRSPAVGSVANAGKYYLSQGNYHGYVCMHLWNQGAEDIRLYFTSENAGLNAIPLSEAGGVTPATNPQNPTTKPQDPTSSTPSSGNVVYCRNSASWGSVYAYMWNSDSDKNAEWPGVQMTDLGGGLWMYEYPKRYANIIFNIGSNQVQTDDMVLPSSDNLYDNGTQQWSRVGDIQDPTTKPQDPTSPPSTTKPQDPTTAPPVTGSNYVYCENEAGWTTVNAYMWNSDTDRNTGWPGAQMTNIGGKIWRYTVPKSFKNIIFNGGSDSNKTSDMAYPGNGYIYNNKTGEWSIYDTSPLQVNSYGTDIEAPQFAGVGITLTASATGQGTVYYKFSADSTVLKDYSTANSVVWKPSSAKTYTLTFEFKDSKGNTNKRTMSYQIKDGSTQEAPFIKTVSPANGQQIKKSAVCNISVSAGGGNTGTKLLFYKYTIKDASGKTVNVPYYTKKTSYSFTPSALGKYILTVSVQNCDNTTIERDFIYDSVNNVTTPTEETSPAVTPTTTPPTPTTPSSGSLIGDADMDGEVTVLDATRVQRWLAELVGDDKLNKTNADVDFDKSVTILDATRIQRFLAELIDKF